MEHQHWWGYLLLALFTGLHCIQADYYFVNEAKSWDDAQDFCRKKYTDLATVQTQQEQDQLLKAAKGLYYGSAWIGLQRTPPNWKWSNGQEVTYHEWDRYRFCALSNQNGTWVDKICDYQYPSVCYSEMSNGTRNYTLVNQAMSWSNAAKYCKQHYTDLVSILSVSENEAVIQVAQGVTQYWIGLSNNPWKWSDGQESTLRDWQKYEPNNPEDALKCVAAHLYGWYDYYCSTSYNFYCCNVTDKKGAMKDRCKLAQTAHTWDNAVKYCRKTNRSLLTVKHESELTQLRKSGYNLWIGLYNYRQNWTWSDGEDVVYTSWKPTVSSLSGICGKVNSKGYWDDDYCSKSLPFMCSTETSNGTLNLTLVTQSLPWYDALNYCRQKYSDLVSIRNANESEAVRNAVKTGIEFWIGLYNDPWKWSDGQNPNFTSWKNPVKNGYKQCVYINTVGTWVLYVCTATAPFFCSGLPTTYRAVVRFTLKGLTADQNPDDPLLAEQVLNQIKEQLSQKTSLDNTTFTWRQQYGKIFQESYENFAVLGMCKIPSV